ncbi:cyclic nucleotide-binding domain (cNMP-BD) protein [Synechococcus sp. CC9902]|uniref:ABC transporter transmembrane domain-containing protein n=1 Tax=Synechococcus sp. (strain CC9902) TaxID=316279 RepID=UPI00005D3D0E|nr:peptidase domain-containing ABC transporter [Synechococcus sp. CC9902]ABB25092.1 cyclic nucleotide-binding domain (cNMP-BD) protein [Synechococcus sp. CC9902]
MSSTSETLSALLSRFSAFQDIDDADLQWLATHSKPFHCSVGQALLFSDRLPEYCYCILEGRGRVLHHDPALRRPVTLAYAQPGDLIGWAGLVRRSPCEWITAAMPLKLVGFPADIFYQLELRSEPFRNWLDTNNSPAELMTVLSHSLRSRPLAEPNEREVLRRLLPSMKLHPARSLRSIADFSAEDTLLLWNSKPPGFTVPVGQPIDSEILDSIPSGFPLRLISVDKSCWSRELYPPLKAPPDSDISPASDLWGNDRYSELLVPDPQGSKESLPEINATPLSNKSSKFFWRGRQIPVVTGVGPIEQTMACLEMLSLFHNVPFRRDVIERACKGSLKGDKPSLELTGDLSTVMGFVGTISDIPTAQLPRLSFPCFALLDKQLIMIHDISRDIVQAVIPEYGRVVFPLIELLENNPGVRVLSLSPGRDSQQKKLTFKWFVPQLKKYRRSLLEVLAASLVLQLLNLAQPLVMQQIFDKVIVQQNLDTLYTLGFVLLGVSLFQGLIGAVRTYLFADTTNRIDIALGAQVIQHLLRLPLRYFDKRPVGELQTRIAELGNIRGFLTGSLLTLALDSVFSVIYIAVMIVYSGVLTAVTLGVVPLFLGLTIVASPIIRGQLRKAAEKNAVTQSYLIESLNGVQTIKAQNAENNVRWQWQRRYSGYMSESFRTLMIGVSTGTIGSFLNQLTGLLTLWVGAYLVIKGQLTIGQLIAFRIISGYVVGPLLNLATSWQSFQGVALSMERLSDVIDTESEGGEVDLDLLPLPPVAGEVVFQDVDFRFNDLAPLVINRVSFSVTAGSFVGIVGRSGSGKSTIMKLLPRLYETVSGRILIDGYDISKLQLGSIRRQIGIVPQESLLFEGSIRDNIALTTPEATPEEIVAAAKIACAHDFIMEQPDGYASRVGERGAGLSGGQRQRIAIARAVLQAPSLLILDEATSALDYLTERQVCVNLKRHFEGSTVFFITHRLSTIRSSDVIIMLESGRLVERGTHDELIKMEGRYFALYSQQESDLD